MGQLSNRQFALYLDKVLAPAEGQVPASGTAVCGCGCGHFVADGRKFVNQQHYDRSKGLSAAQMEELLVRYRQGVSKHQLSRDFGVSLSTVKRALKKRLT